MKSELFAQDNLEISDGQRFALQNSHMLRVSLGPEVLAVKGGMVAFQGQIRFDHEKSGSMAKLLKKVVTSEDIPLMRVSGQGEVFFAQEAGTVHLVNLEGDGISVNGRNLLAFDAAMEWDINRVKGAGIMAGGLFNTTVRGTGTVALCTVGKPVVLDCSQQPTYVDVQAAVAWSSLAGAQRRVQHEHEVDAARRVGRGLPVLLPRPRLRGRPALRVDQRRRPVPGGGGGGLSATCSRADLLDTGRRDDVRHPSVVRFGRYVEADLVVVEEHGDGHTRVHPRQRPVVAPATLAEPVAVDATPPAPARAPRRRPRSRTRRGAGRSARAGPVAPATSVAGEDRPVEIHVGAQHREQHPLPVGQQCVEQRTRPGLAFDGHIRRDGGASPYDIPGEHVLGDRLRGGHRIGQ